MPTPTMPAYRLTLCTALITAGLLLCRAAAADDAGSTVGARGAEWNQYRGPERTGIAAESGLLRAWPEEGPKVLWRRPLGEGFSAIAVTGDHLYTLFATEEDEVAAAFRITDGTEVWRRRIRKKFHDEWGNGPRATPSVDGGTVYVLATQGLLQALDRQTGEVRWRLDLQQRYPVSPALDRLAVTMPPDVKINPEEFGHASSPLVEGDLLIVYTGHREGASLVALDKESGEVRWTALDHPAGHSSLAAVSLNGRRQLVGVLHDEVVGVDTGGELLWSQKLGWTVTQPIAVPPDKILVTATFDIGAMLFQIGSDDGRWSVAPVWRNRLMRHTWSSPVVYEGHVYGFDHGTLRCLSLATGEARWAKRGFGKGSLVLADGLLLVLGDRGKLALAEASPEGFHQTGEVQIFPGKSWTAPSPAQGKLFLRDHRELVAVDLKER